MFSKNHLIYKKILLCIKDMEKQMWGYVGLLSVMWMISIDKYICMQSVYIVVSVSIFPPVPLHQWMSLTLIVMWSKDKEILRTRLSYHLSDLQGTNGNGTECLLSKWGPPVEFSNLILSPGLYLDSCALCNPSEALQFPGNKLHFLCCGNKLYLHLGLI